MGDCHFTAAQIIAATGGRLAAGFRPPPFDKLRAGSAGAEERAECRGIATDSRAAAPGQCFVALCGERFDGHDFVAAALQSGAAGAVVSRIPPGVLGRSGAFVVVVADTLKALGDLARAHRRRFRLPVIGITGSTGKTTTKDMIAAILARRGPVAVTPENYNNEVGVPLALLSLERKHRAAVIEMAMRAAGEVAYLASLAQPTIGVVTNVGLSHLERLGRPEAIADAKAELVAALGDGVAVLNADDPYFRRLAARATGRVVAFGLSETADVRAAEIAPGDDGTSFSLISSAGEAQVRLETPGRHQVMNALAAAAAAMEAGARLDDVAAGLGAFVASHRRAQILQTAAGFRIIDDCYNASPASVEAALEMLSDLRGERKVAILGDMLELGPSAAELHRTIGEQAGRMGLDLLIAVGELGRFIAEGARAEMPPPAVRSTDNVEQAAQWALEFLRGGDIVLVKASRAMAFERITGRLSGV